MTAVLNLIIPVLVALGISFSSADTGLTLGEILDNAESSHNYSCSDSVFNDFKSDLENSAYIDIPLPSDVLREVIYNGASASLEDFAAAGTEILNPFLQWVLNDFAEPLPVLDSWVDPDSGYYISPELVLTDYSTEYNLYLYNSDGVKIFQLAGQGEMNPPNEDNVNYYTKYVSFKDFAITDPSTGAYTVTRHWYHSDFGCYVDTVHTGVCSDLINGRYKQDETESEIIGQAISSDGDSLDIRSDGSIALPNGTVVSPSADGTYAVGDTVYNPTFDLSKADIDDLTSLLDILLSNSTTADTPVSKDYTSLLDAIRSLLSSVSTNVKKISTNVKSLADKIKAIPSNIAESVVSDFVTSTSVMDKTAVELKRRLGYNELVTNVNIISTTFFGKRQFNDNGDITIVPVFDSGKSITTTRPHLYFTLFGKEYDLFSGFSMMDSAVSVFKTIVSVFLFISAILFFFRSIPTILTSCAEVVGVTNPTVITNTFSNFGIFQTPIDKGGK